jgi:putative ABC transport system permease protein
MRRWLEDYAYRIDLKLWMFLLAAFLILSVTIITAGVQALRAALTNPVQSLRYE